MSQPFKADCFWLTLDREGRRGNMGVSKRRNADVRLVSPPIHSRSVQLASAHMFCSSVNATTTTSSSSSPPFHFSGYKYWCVCIFISASVGVSGWREACVSALKCFSSVEVHQWSMREERCARRGNTWTTSSSSSKRRSRSEHNVFPLIPVVSQQISFARLHEPKQWICGFINTSVVVHGLLKK